MSKLVMVISFNSHDTTFGVVAVSLTPQRVVVVFFSAQWAFSIFELNIYTFSYGDTPRRKYAVPFA
jgi:hypothetical protein